MEASGRKRALVVGLLAVVLVAGGWTAYRLLSRPSEEDLWELPEFTEPAAGPRAPTTEAFHVRVGHTTLEEVQALVKARGLSCADTSMREIIKQQREKRQAEAKQAAAEAEARGEEVDAVSSASLQGGPSARERNPQVRLSCTDVAAEAIGDRERPPAVGRWLFIFDSPKHPLRHVSYRRMHRTQTPALKDALSAAEAMRGRFGEPSSRRPEAGLPAMPDKPTASVPVLKPYKLEWAYSDAVAQVTLLNFGKRGVDVLESLEVPWPVRADAPAKPEASAP